MKMIFRITILNFAFLFSYLSGFSFDRPEITSVYDSALFRILNLQPVTARKILDTDLRDDNTFDLYREYLYDWNNAIVVIIDNDENKYNEYRESLDTRLKRIEQFGNENSESYHIIMADIYAHAAMVNLFYNDFIAAFTKLLKANKYVKINLDNYPDYWLNDKLSGTFNITFDMMPTFLKNIAALFGLRGNSDKGVEQLMKYIGNTRDYPGLLSEGLCYLGFALKVAKEEDEACRIIDEKSINKKTPALLHYLVASLQYNAGKTEEALKSMSYFTVNHPETPFPQVDYLTSKLKMNRLDKDADQYLLRFLAIKDLMNYGREIRLKLADFYLMNGDSARYMEMKKKVSTYPKSSTDRDREADVEISRHYEPDPEILKARYLVNGGYYSRADSILKKIDLNALKTPAYKTEYLLLKAKIFRDHPDEALVFCDRTIEAGRNQPEHYAAEAALLAGHILLENNRLNDAERYYKLTGDIKGSNDVYIELIHKKAKNQLKKIEKLSKE